MCEKCVILVSFEVFVSVKEKWIYRLERAGAGNEKRTGVISRSDPYYLFFDGDVVSLFFCGEDDRHQCGCGTVSGDRAYCMGANCGVELFHGFRGGADPPLSGVAFAERILQKTVFGAVPAERTKIVKTHGGAAYTEDDGATYVPIPMETLVSMNMWGFMPSILGELEQAIARFFAEEVPANPLKSECFLPIEVDRLLQAGKATVEVLPSKDKWFGVTYKEDKPFVVESIQNLKDEGVYPEKLWE